MLKNEYTFIAMTVNNQIAFNPSTLDTLKQIIYTDNLNGQMTTATPVLDNKTQELFNILIDIKPNKIKYQIYKLIFKLPQATRELVTEFSRTYLFYMHSFSLPAIMLLFIMDHSRLQQQTYLASRLIKH